MSRPTRILMLEDNPLDMELNIRALQKGGVNAEIAQADNEQSFLDALTTFSPDLILSDYSLPNYDGFKALQATQNFDHSIPFIFVTGAIGEEASVNMLKRGAVDYILKDRLARLPEAVNRALDDAEHKRLLRASEERYRMLLDSSHYGIWDWDIEANTLYLSPQWKLLLGYRDDELENCFGTFEMLLHPDDVDDVLASVESFILNPTDLWDREFRMRHKDGGYVWINARASHKTNSQSIVTRMIGVHVDVSKHRQSEEQLLQAAQVFSSTIEGVMITDSDATILDVNPAFCRITGYSREQAIGQNPKFLRSGHHPSNFYDTMWQSLLIEGQWSGDIWNRRANGEVFPALMTISSVVDKEGSTTGYVFLFADITKSKQVEEQLAFLAHHDELTGLPNRLLLKDRLDQALLNAERNQGKVAVVFIDLDHFKNVNDSLGHSVGDEFLKKVSERLLSNIRSNDTLARTSGDEFILVIENSKAIQDTINVLNKIMNAFRTPYDLERHQILITCSIGVSIFPEDGSCSDELIKNADAAMYRAKQDGRNIYEFYTPEMTESALEHVYLESALLNALKHDQFTQYYQPQYMLSSGRLIGCETLIRWQHPDDGMISPQRFIPIAEQNGTIRDIDCWMLQTACKQGMEWHKKGMPLQSISVNMTGSQIQRENFADTIHDVLNSTGFPKEMLEIEVTESFVMQRPDAGIRQLYKLYNSGISIAIDDFGTGYSSLSYLKQLPVSKIKLDRSFINDITEDKDTLAIVRAISDLAKSLGKTILAEGVETLEQAKQLNELGCEQVQGYYFGRPITAESMTELLSAENNKQTKKKFKVVDCSS
jgi:diguanylate cyclase (GGDEF)-like protein/PAS domain S-box-containing protein